MAKVVTRTGKVYATDIVFLIGSWQL